ncbi:hydrolase, partial [Frankia sp. AgW1.1]|nr:hydrolase [Frankia sp. AgW1.1]
MGDVSAVRRRRAATVWLVSLLFAALTAAGCGFPAGDPSAGGGAAGAAGTAAAVTPPAGVLPPGAVPAQPTPARFGTPFQAGPGPSAAPPSGNGSSHNGAAHNGSPSNGLAGGGSSQHGAHVPSRAVAPPALATLDAGPRPVGRGVVLDAVVEVIGSQTGYPAEM